MQQCSKKPNRDRHGVLVRPNVIVNNIYIIQNKTSSMLIDHNT